MQESNIEIGDTVTTPNGGTGVVRSIDKRTRSHFFRKLYNVRLDDGSLESFEEIVARDDRGKELEKPLGIEKMLEAKPAKEKAPPKPPAAKPKEETRHAREA